MYFKTKTPLLSRKKTKHICLDVEKEAKTNKSSAYLAVKREMLEEKNIILPYNFMKSYTTLVERRFSKLFI